MKNPIYLTDKELVTWHGHQFGVIPSIDDSGEIPLSGDALRQHCNELYRLANAPVVYED